MHKNNLSIKTKINIKIKFTIKNIILNLLILCLINNLTACSCCGEPPCCPNSLGLPCARVDQINKLVDCGKIEVRENICCENLDNLPDNSPPNLENNPLWRKAKIMQIWFAPYEDSAHNFHDASYIYAIAKTGHWKSS